MKVFRVIFKAEADPRVAWIDILCESQLQAVEEAKGYGPEGFNYHPPGGSANDEVEVDQAWWDKAKPSAECMVQDCRNRLAVFCGPILAGAISPALAMIARHAAIWLAVFR